MTLRSQAHALIGRFIADIDSIIRDHAERAVSVALTERGLKGGARAKRLGRAAPLELVPPEPESRPRRAKKPARAKAGAAGTRKRSKPSRKARAEQLTLF